MARVRRVHAQVRGTLPDGTPYDADDPRLLAWVHVTETTSFLAAWHALRRAGACRRPIRTATSRRWRGSAQALGADPVPRSGPRREALIEAMRPELAADERTREVARLILLRRPERLAIAPFQAITLSAGVDLLPGWARRMHGLPAVPLAGPVVRASASGLAQTLRWAFAG